MTAAVYGIPPSGEVWHGLTLLHFFLVGLAGGSAFLAGLASLRREALAPALLRFAALFVVLDLAVLWLESAARFRFTHVWLFLTFRPASAISLGAWGLFLTLLLSLLLLLRPGHARFFAPLLLASSLVVLAYPGMLLSENPGRPLWDGFVTALMPVTGLALAVGFWLLFVRGSLLRLAPPVFLTAALGAVLYPWALAHGDAGERAAWAGLWHDAGLFYLAAVLLLFLAGVLRRRPEIAGGIALFASAFLRSLIVMLGQ